MNWTVYLKALAGFFLGWISHPALWPIGGPFRWAALLYGTWSQESGLNPDSYNPERLGSAGLGQFQADTWNLIMPSMWATAPYNNNNFPDDDPRASPFLQGYAAAVYVNSAIGADLRWLALGLPGYGFPLLRVLWRNGMHGLDALGGIGNGISLGRSYVATEGKAGEAFRLARSISLAPAVLVTYLLWKRIDRKGIV